MSATVHWVSRFAFSGFLLVALTECGGGDSSAPPPPTPMVTISVSPSSIPAGQSATLTWSSINASICSASGGWIGAQLNSGSLGVSPTSPGIYTYTLSCSSSGSSAAAASAKLTVVPAPLVITTATFANGVIGAPYTQTIQVTGGVAPFAWTVSSGALPHNLSLGTGTTSSETVSGTPDTAAQGVVFTIQVTDSAQHVATQAYTVSMLLQADSLVLSPASLDFGNEIVGNASGPVTETLTNTSTSDMLLTTIGTTGSSVAEFDQTTTCGARLAAGTSCAIYVTFTPGQIGPRSAALTITDDTAGSPQSVPLNGVGVTAGLTATLSVDTLSFGTQLVGTTSPVMSVALSNYGTPTLNIGLIAATAGYAETDNCVPSLASGTTCTIRVTFTPGAAGDMTGMLSISDDAPGSPQNVSLSGTGSTNTPLLTGSCVVPLSNCVLRRSSNSGCPMGQPAEHPSALKCTTQPHRSTPVDGARPCRILVSIGPSEGYCETK